MQGRSKPFCSGQARKWVWFVVNILPQTTILLLIYPYNYHVNFPIYVPLWLRKYNMLSDSYLCACKFSLSWNSSSEQVEAAITFMHRSHEISFSCSVEVYYSWFTYLLLAKINLPATVSEKWSGQSGQAMA